eukprot:5112416-Amphidinium_carterae.1
MAVVTHANRFHSADVPFLSMTYPPRMKLKLSLQSSALSLDSPTDSPRKECARSVAQHDADVGLTHVPPFNDQPASCSKCPSTAALGSAMSTPMMASGQYMLA